MHFGYLQEAYLQLVTTITPGPQSITYFVPSILLIAGLLIPPHVISHNALAALVVPITIASTVHAWLAMKSLDVVSVDTLWSVFFFLLFRDPRADFRRLLSGDQGEHEGKGTGMSNGEAKNDDANGRLPVVSEEEYPKDLASRIQWVLCLTQERPLTSWKTGETSHDASVLPPYVKKSRWGFIRPILVVLVPAVLLTMPLALQLKAHDPFFSAPGQSLNMPFATLGIDAPATVAFLQQALPKQLLRTLTLGLYLYSLMILLFLPRYLLLVMLTFLVPSGSTARWSPHTWPRPHFGPFSAVLDHGLRGFWGKWWHQQMRHAVSEPGRWLSTKLGLRRKGLPRYALICCSAFLLSGLTHAGLVPAEPRWAKLYKPWELGLRVAAFFWIQPAGFLAEVLLVEPILRRLAGALTHPVGPIFVRMLRLCWVVLFMSLALTFLHDPFIELGYWKIWPPSFTPAGTRSILRGNWIL